jgi:primase-polymerase (primpol)-like protein
MLASRHGADIRDLKEGNESRLSVKYQTATPGEPFDRSRADAALYAHLASWTNGNAARIDRMLEQSALYRPKWDRLDYKYATIRFALNGR